VKNKKTNSYFKSDKKETICEDEITTCSTPSNIF